MKHKPAIYSLLRLHAELGGKLNDNRQHAERIAAEMEAVEKVIKLFDPAYNLRSISAKRRYRTNEHFKRGTVYSTALDVLRRASRPLSARSIAKQMLHERGVREPSDKLIRDTIAAMSRSLKRHRGQAVIAHENHWPIRWSVKRQTDR